jgi:EAL domain-containing protein (putative c-di-GMP-specific phosphodiesterase class I)
VQRASVVEEVRAALEESGLAPSCLVLEITESVLVANDEVVLERLHALKALGVRLAIDDFGTGYSSLNYLRILPVDVLKIDKAFADRVGEQHEDAMLLRGIIDLGHMLGIEVVAEGIERAEQAVELRALGCDRAQGFWFGRPGPEEAVAGVLGIDGGSDRRRPVRAAGRRQRSTV